MKVSVVYLPCCCLPCCQSKLRNSKKVFAISLYKVFCHLVDVRESCLDGGSHGDGLVGVDRLGGGAAKDVLARLLHLGHPDEKNETFK